MTTSHGDRTNVKVLDSWALLAWLKDENPGADLMDELLEEAQQNRVHLIMNIVNLGEVFYLMAKARNMEDAELAIEKLRALPIVIKPASNNLVMEAAWIKARYPISYADAFAAATSKLEKAPLVTGDPEFRLPSAEGILRLDWIGPE